MYVKLAGFAFSFSNNNNKPTLNISWKKEKKMATD